MERAQIYPDAQGRRQIARRVAAIDATAGVLPDDRDWPEWLDDVRGEPADDGLSDRPPA
jgi:hypothetical protein